MADNDRPDQSGSGDDDKQPPNPFEMLFGAGAAGGQPDFEAMMRQVQQMFTQMSGGMFGAPADSQQQWEAVRDLARKVVTSKGADPTPTQASRRALGDASRIVDSWLDRHVELPPTDGKVQAWSRAEWVEHSMATWRRLIDPVATALADAMAGLAPEESESGQDNPMAGLEAMLRPLMRQTGSTVFNAQAAEAIGTLAASCVSATEVTLPIQGEHATSVALLPTNVDAFADGLEQSDTDIWLVLTLRESARQRLFAHAPWVGEKLMSLVERYARGITIDTSRIEEAMGQVEQVTNPNELAELSEGLQGSLFSPKRTPEQDQVLAELETLLALVDGWVEDVTADVTGQWMPNAEPIVESLRRRRASSGPTEAAFKALVGLELRPRRVRDATNLWAAVREAGGAERREGLWRHPDLLPTTADLDDPIGFVQGGSGGDEPAASDDFDAELRRLLDSADSDSEGSGDDTPGTGSTGDDRDPGGSTTDPDHRPGGDT